MSTTQTELDPALEKFDLLPIELRHADGSLAAHTVLRALVQDPAIEAGEYFMVAEPFPGQQLVQPIRVSEDHSVDLSGLASSLAERSNVSSSAVARVGENAFSRSTKARRVGTLDGVVGAVAVAGYVMGPATTLGLLETYASVGYPLLRFFKGDKRSSKSILGIRVFEFEGVPLGRYPLKTSSASRIKEEIEGNEAWIRPIGTHLVVRLPESAKHRMQHGPLNIIMLSGTSLRVQIARGRALRLDRVEYGDPILDGFSDNLDMDRESAIDSSVTHFRGDEIEKIAGSCPAAALRLAYALMSANDERLSAAVLGKIGESGPGTALLGELSGPWSDIYVIRAEILSRANRGWESLKATLAAAELGLPAYSSGLDLLTRQLSTHLMIARSIDVKDGNARELAALARSQMGKIADGLELIQPFAAACDFGVALTAWHSYDSSMVAAAEPG